ncbi:hypothetical protein CA233_17470 [Sphingomonas sp. ABOLD]|uniref:Uncharacterized protein n=1 Tax=Sphingomonas trueperi TaxID=53317 RepID=A0A7X6BFQ7_9SPHN|nr:MULTISPECIES: hypothetical protein [Sphingomonas]NJC00098.1 hypothetical protein [Sphingomonas trueperi]RSV42332.1 hypothetical protein CA233_17470 [Sphingomonas sp. ABOLD]
MSQQLFHGILHLGDLNIDIEGLVDERGQNVDQHDLEWCRVAVVGRQTPWDLAPAERCYPRRRALEFAETEECDGPVLQERQCAGQKMVADTLKPRTCQRR